MAIIDLDSHLRDGWFLDEFYKLDGPFAAETRKRVGEGALYYSMFEHNLGPEVDRAAVDSFKNPVPHTVLFECTAEFLMFWMHRMDDDYEILKDEGFAPGLNAFPSEYVRLADR